MNVEDGWRNRFIGMKMNTAVDGREAWYWELRDIESPSSYLRLCSRMLIAKKKDSKIMTREIPKSSLSSITQFNKVFHPPGLLLTVCVFKTLYICPHDYIPSGTRQWFDVL
jgi:hypothetical protein